MVHLNDPTVYKPLHNISPTLKEAIINKLTSLRNKGFLKQTWFEFCKPPRQTRTSRLYFLKKIHKNPMGIRPIVSSCNSITEPISQFVDRWLQPHVKKITIISKRYNRFSKPNRNNITRRMFISIYRGILPLHKYPPRGRKTKCTILHTDQSRYIYTTSTTVTGSLS